MFLAVLLSVCWDQRRWAVLVGVPHSTAALNYIFTYERAITLSPRLEARIAAATGEANRVQGGNSLPDGSEFVPALIKKWLLLPRDPGGPHPASHTFILLLFHFCFFPLHLASSITAPGFCCCCSLACAALPASLRPLHRFAVAPGRVGGGVEGVEGGGGSRSFRR